MNIALRFFVFGLMTGPVIVGGFLVFGVVLKASAGQPAAAAPEEAAVAFVNVNLIRMDRERIETGRTVLARGGRIAAIGARSAVTVPDDALVIQGEGRFLTPGLTDTHVHLVGDGTAFGGGAARPDSTASAALGQRAPRPGPRGLGRTGSAVPSPARGRRRGRAGRRPRRHRHAAGPPLLQLSESGTHNRSRKGLTGTSGAGATAGPSDDRAKPRFTMAARTVWFWGGGRRYAPSPTSLGCGGFQADQQPATSSAAAARAGAEGGRNPTFSPPRVTVLRLQDARTFWPCSRSWP